MVFEAIVIGMSAGGFEALKSILPLLSSDFSLAIIIVHHTSPDSSGFLVQHLNDLSLVEIKEADEKEFIRPGVVYFAPANYHLLIEKDKTFSMTIDGKVNYARPAIDVLFESAADAYGAGLIGIILTGASKDGSEGLKKIKESGGLVIVQAPDTAQFKIMPEAAMAATEVDRVIPLAELGTYLNQLPGARHA